MSRIDGINKNLPSQYLKKDEKAGRGNNHGATNVRVDMTAQTNKLIVELHLKVQLKSKENFGTHAGVNGLPASGGVDLSQFTYNGRPITDLSQDEAKELVSEGGYFGVEKTAQRIFDFMVAGAGDDPEKLQVGRDAILKGFKDAEQLFGGTLPEISYKTLDKVLAMVDEKIREAGGSVIDVKA